ncbi:hypothetical protein AOL_s00076g538 [Orbilia oligospora ATCC 24927]|uniref:Uncharacterized protein n=3 Tax=Orbilia oligospora TaxID=2813651 RepID=G1XA80_ARTOA|nr:hypothetical protein AOL_s00076g538 [Orbilia oligospora ATCC 24927]EGX49897.1 hypothetical protein AOL_s00076g538 [Orbilia oligospora ATCC 24927]KAF3127282.1 hypothetical protein TWF703_009978 [Orbilia oligospora]
MSNSPVDSRPAVASLPSQTNPSNTLDVRSTGQEPVNMAPAMQQTNTDLDVNRVEAIPSAPPPAYIPPPECRTSRIYDFGDLDLTNHPDNDPERAVPPPPYTGPSRDQAVVIYSHTSPSGDATATVYYPTMDSYMKASKRRRLYGAVTLAAFIIVGIILLGSLIARQNMGGSTDTADRT